MNISGEVVLRLFLGEGDNDRQFIKYSNGNLLSQEFAQLSIAVGRLLVMPTTLAMLIMFGEHWWDDHKWTSLLMTPQQREHKKKMNNLKEYVANIIEERHKLVK